MSKSKKYYEMKINNRKNLVTLQTLTCSIFKSKEIKMCKQRKRESDSKYELRHVKCLNYGYNEM